MLGWNKWIILILINIYSWCSTIYKQCKEYVDNWCCTICKWCKLIVGAQQINTISFETIQYSTLNKTNLLSILLELKWQLHFLLIFINFCCTVFFFLFFKILLKLREIIENTILLLNICASESGCYGALPLRLVILLFVIISHNYMGKNICKYVRNAAILLVPFIFLFWFSSFIVLFTFFILLLLPCIFFTYSFSTETLCKILFFAEYLCFTIRLLCSPSLQEWQFCHLLLPHIITWKISANMSGM